MVVGALEREKQTDRLFFALSDATRRDIVTQTLDRARSVSELGRLYPMSLTAVQKHVEVLVGAGLVSKRRRGREQLVRGEIEQLRRARQLLDDLEALWRARLERFEACRVYQSCAATSSVPSGSSVVISSSSSPGSR